MTETNKVRVIMQIHSSMSSLSSSDVYLEHIVELPFPPFVGLELIDGDWSATLVEIAWYHQERAFHAFTESDKTLYNWHRRQLNGAMEERPSMDAIVADYLESGWQRQRTQ